MFIKNIKKISLPFFIFILSIIILNTYIVIAIYTQKQISKNTFRLHIVANSNSLSDQITKLKINEKISKYIASVTKNSNSKNDIIKNIKENMNNILNTINTELKNENVTYLASAKLGTISYEEKINENYDMPAGNYDSLQIILGDGKGKNIWSLLFPNKDDIQNLSGLETILPGISSLYGENTNSDNNQDITYSFKILEILNDLKFKK